MPKPRPFFLTVDEAAEVRGCSPANIRVYLAQKRIPGAYFDRRQWSIPRNFKVMPVRQGRPPKHRKG